MKYNLNNNKKKEPTSKHMTNKVITLKIIAH